MVEWHSTRTQTNSLRYSFTQRQNFTLLYSHLDLLDVQKVLYRIAGENQETRFIAVPQQADYPFCENRSRRDLGPHLQQSQVVEYFEAVQADGFGQGSSCIAVAAYRDRHTMLR